jgi:hypothetical protein
MQLQTGQSRLLVSLGAERLFSHHLQLAPSGALFRGLGLRLPASKVPASTACKFTSVSTDGWPCHIRRPS